MMSRASLLILPLLSVMSACRSVGSAPQESIPQRPPLPYEISDDAAIAARLRPLWSAHLNGNQREIRIWLPHGGPPSIAPDVFYRIFDDGGRVSGDAFFYWPTDIFYLPNRQVDRSKSDKMLVKLRGAFHNRCKTFRDAHSMEVCRAQFVTPPDWKAILHAMDVHHVWTLPDMHTLKRPSSGKFDIVFDGWGMAIEVREGVSYRSYAYSDPDHYIDLWPEAGDAVGILKALGLAASLLPRLQ